MTAYGTHGKETIHTRGIPDSRGKKIRGEDQFLDLVKEDSSHWCANCASPTYDDWKYDYDEMNDKEKQKMIKYSLKNKRKIFER